MVKLWGVSQKFLQISQNIDDFKHNNSQGFSNSLNFINKTHLIRENFHFHYMYLQKLNIVFNLDFSKIMLPFCFS